MMLRRSLSSLIVFIFSVSLIMPKTYAQTGLALPQPGTMMDLSPAFQPTLIKGLTIHKDNPFLFDFIVDAGDDATAVNNRSYLKNEADRLVKYFFACLTIPEKDIWVNLSPYEKDRMVPEALGQTALGRDLLIQDYILKQLAASLIYPEKDLGKEFWNRVYSKAQQIYGSSVTIPVNTFNKVWVVADKASIFENGQTVFVVNGHLKVMMEEDYLATEKHSIISASGNNANGLGKKIIHDLVLPEIEREVNTGKNFAMLRQIFYSQILATWFKRNLKEALINQIYANKATVKGIDQNDIKTNKAIYQQYLKAYKKGVFSYIKEEVQYDGQMKPRKYFSGGYSSRLSISKAMAVPENALSGKDFSMKVVLKVDGTRGSSRVSSKSIGNSRAVLLKGPAKLVIKASKRTVRRPGANRTNSMKDWLEAFYGKPPVLETVFEKNHKNFWATSLRYNGHNVIIRMNDTTYHDKQANQEPMYDIFIDLDPSGYQAYIQLKLNPKNNTVLAEETLRSFFIKDKRKEKYLWLKPLLDNWIRWLDGQTVDRTSQLLGIAPVYNVEFNSHSPFGVPIYKPTTYVPGQGGVVQLPPPITGPNQLQVPEILLTRKTLVFYGGLGAVVPRFYAQYLKEYGQKYKVDFDVVDLLPKEAALRRIQESDLPYRNYYQASEYRIDPKNPPAGVVILTRPDTHYPLIKWANEAGVPVFVEKPLVHPDDLGAMAKHFRQYPKELFAIDFFFDNPSVHEALRYINQGKIGRIRAIRGEMIEHNGLERGREWLVFPPVSGGGLAMDMMVHLTALAEMLLERWNDTLINTELDPAKLIFSRYEGAPEGTETFAQIEGKVGGSVDLKLGAGKGLHRSAYYLIVEGDQGTVEINLGTEHEKGFMKFTPKEGDPVKIENLTGNIGYDETTQKIVRSAQDGHSITQAERDFRVHATMVSVSLVHVAQMMFGENYYQLPLHQDPEKIVLENRGSMSWPDRQRQYLEEADNLIHQIEQYLESNTIIIVENKSHKRLKIDSYSSVMLNDVSVGFLDLNARKKTVSLLLLDENKKGASEILEIENQIKSIVERNGWVWKGSGDKAALSNPIDFNKGGIDLNAQNMAMTVTKNAQGGVEVKINQAMIEEIKRSGVWSADPIIIDISPVQIRSLLGQSIPRNN